MVFFSLGANHHDLALMEIGETATVPGPHAVGLAHVAFKVGNTVNELRDFKQHLEKCHVPILGMSTIRSANRST